MDILGFIIQCTQPPLSEPLLNSVFPVVVNTILASDDNSVLQVELALVLFFDFFLECGNNRVIFGANHLSYLV